MVDIKYTQKPSAHCLFHCGSVSGWWGLGAGPSQRKQLVEDMSLRSTLSLAPYAISRCSLPLRGEHSPALWCIDLPQATGPRDRGTKSSSEPMNSMNLSSLNTTCSIRGFAERLRVHYHCKTLHQIKVNSFCLFLVERYVERKKQVFVYLKVI